VECRLRRTLNLKSLNMDSNLYTLLDQVTSHPMAILVTPTHHREQSEHENKHLANQTEDIR